MNQHERIEVRAWSDPKSKPEVDYGPAGWAALIAGLIIGWRVWDWLTPDIPLGYIGMAWWTLLAICFGAGVTYWALKALPAVARFVARNAAEGWRQGNNR